MPNTNKGRPTKVTPETVRKLSKYLEKGYSVQKACFLSGISRDTYNMHLQKDADFSDKMSIAQNEITEKAKSVVISKIKEGNVHIAKWWLEKKVPDEFGKNVARPEYKLPPEQKEFTEEELEQLDRGIEMMVKTYNRRKERETKSEEKNYEGTE